MGNSGPLLSAAALSPENKRRRWCPTRRVKRGRGEFLVASPLPPLWLEPLWGGWNPCILAGPQLSNASSHTTGQAIRNTCAAAKTCPEDVKSGSAISPICALLCLVLSFFPHLMIPNSVCRPSKQHNPLQPPTFVAHLLSCVSF